MPSRRIYNVCMDFLRLKVNKREKLLIHNDDRAQMVIA